MTPFHIERLLNGFYRVRCRASGLVALYNADGTPRSTTYAAHDKAIASALQAHDDAQQVRKVSLAADLVSIYHRATGARSIEGRTA